MISKILRSLFAGLLFVVGVFLLASSLPDWHEKGFQILTNGEKGKDAFSGIFFSVVFIVYAIWEFFLIFKKDKT